jgi:hypothetical protein
MTSDGVNGEAIKILASSLSMFHKRAADSTAIETSCCRHKMAFASLQRRSCSAPHPVQNGSNCQPAGRGQVRAPSDAAEPQLSSPEPRAREAVRRHD